MDGGVGVKWSSYIANHTGDLQSTVEKNPLVPI